MKNERAESGYVLLGIVIGIVILGIFLVAAVPLWQKVTQREREAELIWRGYQYMQAIELYQKKFPGAYPPSVDILVEQKFLRKAYTDPMSEDGKWQLLRQLSPELQPGQPSQQPGARSGITSLNQSQARLRTPGSATPGPPGATRQAAGSRFQSSLGRSLSDQGMGGVVGVASRSAEKTFYQVPGKEKYKDWLFVWGAQPAMATPGLPGQVGQAGQAGQIGQAGQAGQPRQGGQLGGPAFPGMGQPGQGASPFPGLPPPPSLTSIGMGRSAAPGQMVPGPGQMGNVPGTQPQPQQRQQQQPQQQRQPQPRRPPD